MKKSAPELPAKGASKTILEGRKKQTAKIKPLATTKAAVAASET
jgi:hypothetical protein